jgi:hypothetical protein
MALEELKKYHGRSQGMWEIREFNLSRAVAGLTRSLEGRRQVLTKPRREILQVGRGFDAALLDDRAAIRDKLLDVQATPGQLRAWFGELTGPSCGCNPTDPDVRCLPSTDQQVERDFRDYISSLCCEIFQGSKKTVEYHSIEYLVYLMLKEIPWEDAKVAHVSLLPLADKVAQYVKGHHGVWDGDWIMLTDDTTRGSYVIMKEINA